MPESRIESAAPAHIGLWAVLLSAPMLAVWPSSPPRADAVYKSFDSEGHVVYSDRPDSSPQKLGSPMQDLQSPPREIRVCWTNCFTLELDGGRYRRVDGTDETWTLEKFTPQSVVLRRHDVPAAWNGFSADVAYAGQVSDDRLINVLVNGMPTPGIVAAWGVALDTLPGSNAERDRRQSAQLAAAGAPDSSDVDPVADTQWSVTEAPPPLRGEEQPPCNNDGSLWTPGYWAWGIQGYHWMPGLWTRAPRMGLLWTPGYWGFAGAMYVFHRGYWSTQVGYYGGINYGYGYGGLGYTGGHWLGNSFAYNASVSNVNMSVIHNTYHETVVNKVAANRVSYNGGPAGTRAVPTAAEDALVARSEPRLPPSPNGSAQKQLSAGQAGAPKAANSRPAKAQPSNH